MEGGEIMTTPQDIIHGLEFDYETNSDLSNSKSTISATISGGGGGGGGGGGH